MAAHRAGIKRVVLPDRNQKDLVDVPEQARDELDIQFIKRMEQIFPLVLTNGPKPLLAPTPRPTKSESPPSSEQPAAG